MRLTATIEALRRFERDTRPVDPELEAALARRWDELPEHAKVPAQALGRRTAGCEGTHGVFPRCNLACTPCYHSRDANRVRVDGQHTVAEIDRQMALLRRLRGPGQNAQLIGGEVTLLSPSDHADALLTMRRHGRKPMSMSHGDFDYDYLHALVVGPDGEPRFRSVSFAGHFDSMMLGRRGIKRALSEAELHPYRQRFCEMFARLERETGVTSYLAHNMTVTPGNVGQIRELIESCHDMGFRMFSFQPAAFVGNPSRWKHSYRELSQDEVWSEIEAGAGARLPATGPRTAPTSVSAGCRCSTTGTRATCRCARASSRRSGAWTSTSRRGCWRRSWRARSPRIRARWRTRRAGCRGSCAAPAACVRCVRTGRGR
jgi:hypothetical protein